MAAGGGNYYPGTITAVINSCVKNGNSYTINADFTFVCDYVYGAKLPSVSLQSTSGGTADFIGNRYENDPLNISFTITANEGDIITITYAEWSDPSESGDMVYLESPVNIYTIPSDTSISGQARIERTEQTDISGQARIERTEQTDISGQAFIYHINQTEITGQVSIIQTIPEKQPQLWEYSAPKVATDWGCSSANDKSPQSWEHVEPEKEPETWEYEQYEIKPILPVYNGANYGGFGASYGVAYGSSIERPLPAEQ